MPHKAALDKLGQDLLIMAEMCERNIDTAIMALIDRDEEMADGVVAYDTEIDQMEMSVERDCLALLARPQLDDQARRFITAGITIGGSLERIGDLAVEISRHVSALVREKSILGQMLEFNELVEQIEQILRESIEALIERDVRLARKIIGEYEAVNNEMVAIFAEITGVMRENPAIIERALHIFLVAALLARVADQTMSVAEEVIFMVEGKTVRHTVRDFSPVPVEAADDEDEEDSSIIEEAVVRRVRETRIQRKN